MTRGCIEVSDGSLWGFFPVNIDVKQGGILSPALFQAYIDDLIQNCTKANVGATFNKLNVSIIVYADDILLLSPVDSHLQYLLNICQEFSSNWRINFSALKSTIVEFGPQLFNNATFSINNNIIPRNNSLKYLGVIIDNKLNFNKYASDKFINTQKSFFSLSFLGLRPNTISPHLQAFIYKEYCLSQFTYGLETSVLNKETRNYLNTCQNNILRQILGLHKLCHMSKILKCLKIYNFEDLYIFSKLSFLATVHKNDISNHIFYSLIANKKKKRSKSFLQDIKVLEDRFILNIGTIYNECIELKKSI